VISRQNFTPRGPRYYCYILCWLFFTFFTLFHTFSGTMAVMQWVADRIIQSVMVMYSVCVCLLLWSLLWHTWVILGLWHWSCEWRCCFNAAVALTCYTLAQSLLYVVGGETALSSWHSQHGHFILLLLIIYHKCLALRVLIINLCWNCWRLDTI